jgi:hypothetical protein
MKTILKLAGCWAAYFVALVVSFAVVGALKLHTNPPLDNLPATVRMLLALAAGAVLVAGLFPMVRGLAGGAATRMAAMINFLLLALALNTMIEASFFSTIQNGAISADGVYYACLVALTGGALGLLFGDRAGGAGLRHAGVVDWIGRGLIAWLSWPVIYFVFGMCVAPVVMQYYKALSWLRIPPVGTIIGIQLVRSLIFLASSLPLIALWKGSRQGLWLSLGLAHAAAVGWFGLVQATFFPMAMRVAHTLEITADSFAYAGLLVVLFSWVGEAQVRTASMPQPGAIEAH